MISQPLLSYKSNRNIKSYLVRAKLLPLDPNSTLSPRIQYHLNIRNQFEPLTNMEDLKLYNTTIYITHFYNLYNIITPTIEVNLLIYVMT